MADYTGSNSHLTDAEIAELLAEREARWSEERRARKQLKHLTPKTLGQKPGAPNTLINRVVTKGTFGPVGGKKKSLKSYTAHMMAVALAAGKPAMGYEHWTVPTALPVLTFIGEGGESALKRRHQRIALDLYDIADVSELPLHAVTGAADMTGDGFRDKLETVVWAMEREHGQGPGLVILDSLYNYHPEDTEAGNLYERGPMLRQFQEVVFETVGGDVTLWVVDHFNKHSSGTDLDEIAWSGMAQWADSWLLMDHREDPNTTERLYKLNLEIGSREAWNGLYEVDIDLGPFDEDALCDVRPMRVTVDRVGGFAKKSSDKGLSSDMLDIAIYKMVDSGDYTRKQIENGIEGGSHDRIRKRLNKLIGDSLLTVERGPHQEGTRMVERDLIRRTGKLRAQPQPRL